MAYYIQTIVTQIKNIVKNSNIFLSVSMGMGIIILESIIPPLPLAVFIALNMIVFGKILGFIISLVATIIGSSLSFYIFRTLSHKLHNKMNKYEKTKKISHLIHRMGEISFTKLVIILAIPFTPAFSINIGAALSKMPYKKYFLALVISKIFMVYFWGFVGTTFFESVSDITVIFKLVLLMLIAFIISKIVIKKFDVE